MQLFRLIQTLSVISLLLFSTTPAVEGDSIPQPEPVVSAEKWQKLQAAMQDGGTTETKKDETVYKGMNSSKIVVLTLKIMFYLGVIVLILYFALKAVKKKMAGGYAPRVSGRFFDVLESRHVGPQKNVSLIKIGNRLIVIGVADGGISLLSQIDNLEEINSIMSGSNRGDGSAVAGSFSETIDAFLSKFRKDGRGVPLSQFSKNMDTAE
ncbi:MAG: flagellar biosynthetic protein FliO [Fibrobacteres bacterium]|nr:flagellar biosynthetic protein FliO [Fibrobacterota bacterium]